MGRVVLRSGEAIPPGGTGHIRLRLEEPLVAVGGDRFVVRRYSPLETLGGGVILDPDPFLRQKDRQAALEGLRILDEGSLAEKLAWKIRSRGGEGMTMEALRGWIQADPSARDQALARLHAEGILFAIEKDHVVHRDAVSAVREGVLAHLERFHRANPLKPGAPKEDLRGQNPVEGRGPHEALRPERPSPPLFNRVLQMLGQEGKVAVEREIVRLAAFRPQVGEEAAALREQILRIYREAGSQPPLREELAAKVNRDARTVGDLLRLLSGEGLLIRISDALYFDARAYEAIRAAVVSYLQSHQGMTVAEFRDAVGTTRKYAVPLLEHFDQIRLTVRVGDKRVLGRSAPPA
jgi:selenocysteine-specific elongation factor